MDEATRSEIDNIKEDIREVKELLKASSCPQDGCRFMESQGKKSGSIANWLTLVAIMVTIALQLFGGTS